jgi:sRNA-binding carbon storage regulator CsrA
MLSAGVPTSAVVALILTRTPGQSIVLLTPEGHRITIRAEREGPVTDDIRHYIDAPREVQVFREELLELPERHQARRARLREAAEPRSPQRDLKSPTRFPVLLALRRGPGRRRRAKRAALEDVEKVLTDGAECVVACVQVC